MARSRVGSPGLGTVTGGASDPGRVLGMRRSSLREPGLTPLGGGCHSVKPAVFTWASLRGGSSRRGPDRASIHVIASTSITASGRAAAFGSDREPDEALADEALSGLGASADA